MRDKERLHDYRFVPEPNLPPLRLSDESRSEVNGQRLVSVSDISRSLPPLPHHVRHSLCRDHSLTLEQANTLQVGTIASLQCLTVV
jgi:aspartyl-tRNA(Asn)/glutamyl-tRNA(Gln) amidotransferase subunit B